MGAALIAKYCIYRNQVNANLGKCSEIRKRVQKNARPGSAPSEERDFTLCEDATQIKLSRMARQAMQGLKPVELCNGAGPTSLPNGSMAPDRKRSRAERRRRCGVISDASQLALLDNGIDVADNELITSLDLEAPLFLARGHRGVVFLSRQRGELGSMVAIKRSRNPNSDKENEATWLARCNELGLGPRLLHTGLKDAFVMEYIDGKLIGEFLERTDDSSLARSVVASLLEQCRCLDKAGIEKAEMLRLNRHVIVSRSPNSVNAFCTMLDFERCSFSARPRNVTQLCQYLSSSWVATQLARLNINVDVMRLRHSAALYKKDPGERTLRAVTADLGLLTEASGEKCAGKEFGCCRLDMLRGTVQHLQPTESAGRLPYARQECA